MEDTSASAPEAVEAVEAAAVDTAEATGEAPETVEQAEAVETPKRPSWSDELAKVEAISPQAAELMRKMQGDYTRYYDRERSFYRSFDAWLGSHLQSRLRFANTQLSLHELITYYDAHGAFRPRAHTSRSTDLAIRADFSESNHAQWQQHLGPCFRNDIVYGHTAIDDRILNFAGINFIGQLRQF